MLPNGLYEQVINKAIEEELSKGDKISRTEKIDAAESSKVLSSYVAEIIEKSLDILKDSGYDTNQQIEFVNNIIKSAIKSSNSQTDSIYVSGRAEQLLAVYDKKNTILSVDEKADLPRPVTSIARSSIFTGAKNEPQMFTELKKEIVSCDRIEMIVSFIKWSGLRLLIDELRQFTTNGGELSIITTSYMGATDVKAIEELSKLPNTRIKVSYDTKITRLHAKAYIFYRNTGFTTAYVGSSNMSNAALTSGLEWNLKITQKDSPDTIKKITATFETNWNSSEFEYYDEGQKERLARALKAERYHKNDDTNKYTVDVTPYSYQQEILDKLQAEREIRGHYKNLLVAATGTGKTVIAALDYKRFVKSHPGKPARLLFVAHREEILNQALYTFRAVLKDPNFGDTLVGRNTPDGIDHLFISIQSFNSKDFASKTSENFYQFVIVDEFHHSAAPSYKKLLEYYKPEILLGLTATPERMDGKSVLEYFDNRIAAEIRLPEAINRKLLCPFQYFGVTDTVDLDTLKWARGGYDKGELTNIYTFSGAVSDRRADMVRSSLIKYSADIEEVKALGFCVSIEHARFMSEFFNNHGIPAMCLTGDSPEEERSSAKYKLIQGTIKVIFVVDLYNEGVDIPEVNQVIMLRPTQSPIVFIQQLGRGLRKADGKEFAVILDFIGNYNNNFMIPIALSGDRTYNKDNIRRYVMEGGKIIPGASTVHFDKVSKQRIFESIDKSTLRLTMLKEKYELLKDRLGRIPSIIDFYNYGEIDPMLFIEYTKESYHSFLKRIEPYYKILFSKEQEEMLAFVSQFLMNGPSMIAASSSASSTAPLAVLFFFRRQASSHIRESVSATAEYFS